MGPFEKDFKDLGVTGKISFYKAPEFFYCFARLPLLY